jgi:hypothetical protein
MKKLVTICAVMVLCLCISQASFGAITINVTASSAPNSGTTVWNGYVANALYALENGLSTNGDRSTSPTGYEAAPDQVGPWEIAVTSFTSWRGTINPTGAFANEHGNRMHFGLYAIGDGVTQFRLEDLTFELHSSDAGVDEGVPWSDTLVFVGDFIGDSYSATRFGVDWGADRIRGTSDDIRYTSGNGTTLVDELGYVGVGNAWWPAGDDPTPGSPAGGALAAMDEHFAWVAGLQPIDVTCTYSILGSTGSDMVTVIPEPATMCLLGLGVLGLLKKRRA